MFYFVHLGRKTFLTESKHRAICEAGAAMGGRDELKKPTFKDHIEAGAAWNFPERRTVNSPDLRTWSLRDRVVLCSWGTPLSLSEMLLHKKIEAGKAPPQHAGTQRG